MSLYIGYNEEAIKAMTLEQFIEMHQHLKTLTYLQGDWERITGKKVAQAKAEVPKEQDGADNE